MTKYSVLLICVPFHPLKNSYNAATNFDHMIGRDTAGSNCTDKKKFSVYIK